ncbi:MAG: hypothetical protein MK101_04040 [Phycisphaerales bacterium]|nr:hypothetical protein [Phycisphaerales bacterium]
MAASLLLVGAILLLVSVRHWLWAGTLQGRPLRLAARVWAPLLAALPALGAIPGQQSTALVQQGALLGGALVGAVATLIMLAPAATGTKADPWDDDHRIDLRWPAAGVVLLLVALAGRLPQSALMVLFALAAVMPWAESIPRRGETWGGPGVGALSLALLGGMAMATAMAIAGHVWMLVVCLGCAAAVLFMCARRLGGHAGIEAAMWSATLAALAGPGLLGWEALAASVGRLTAAGEPHVGRLGLLAVPALALLVPCGVLAGFSRWPAIGRVAAVVVSGGGLIVMGVLALV